MSTAPTSTTQSKTVDYFAVFGLPRKLWIEMSALEQKFLQLSWKLHPDNFVNAPEEEREVSLKRSSELNDAYRTLRDPVGRVEYLLGIEGARKEGERKASTNSKLHRSCSKRFSSSTNRSTNFAKQKPREAVSPR